MNIKRLLLIFTIISIFLSLNGYIQIQSNEEVLFDTLFDIESSYKRRANLIPNLIEVIKGYTKDEADMLDIITETRAKVNSIQLNKDVFNNPLILQNFRSNQDNLSLAIANLMFILEKYPELKADQDFKNLLSELKGAENRINAAQIRYNNFAQKFNLSIRVFPNSLINFLFLKFEHKDLFINDEGANIFPNTNLGYPRNNSINDSESNNSFWVIKDTSMKEFS